MPTLDAPLVATDDDGLEELVVLALLVALPDSLDRVLARLALAQDQTLERNGIALPALIAVHSVVPANNGGDLANANLLDGRQQLLHVTGAGLGVGITAVAEEVDEDLGNPIFLGGPEKGVQMGLLRVLEEGGGQVSSLASHPQARRQRLDPTLTTPPWETRPQR